MPAQIAVVRFAEFHAQNRTVYDCLARFSEEVDQTHRRRSRRLIALGADALRYLSILNPQRRA